MRMFLVMVIIGVGGVANAQIGSCPQCTGGVCVASPPKDTISKMQIGELCKKNGSIMVVVGYDAVYTNGRCDSTGLPAGIYTFDYVGVLPNGEINCRYTRIEHRQSYVSSCFGGGCSGGSCPNCR